MKLPPYPKYKSSGVEWLGVVPEHWEVKRLGYVTQCLDGKRVPLNSEDRSDRRGDYPYWGANSIVDHIDAWLFDEPLVLLGEDGAPFFERNKTVAFFVQGKIWVNNHAHVIRPAKRCEPRYLTYALNQTQYGAFIDGSTRDKLTQGDMNSIPVAYPPPTEQRSIAAFLDRETGRVDRLVAKKRELIERLKEKRTALISRTVTRGLPPAASRAAGLPANPPLKPSGLEWLGDIPKYWEVVPLGYLVRFSGGATPDKSNSAFWEGTIPWVSPKDMKVSLIADAEDHISQEALDTRALNLLPIDSVLIVVRGMILVHSFPVARTAAPVTINQDMKALACGKRIMPRFLTWSFTGFAKTFVSFADESAHGTRKLDSGTLSRFPILLPPLPEQAAIAAYLDLETAKLDALVLKVEEAVERLQEYRTALITAAVTGKIDVRAAASFHSENHHPANEVSL